MSESPEETIRAALREPYEVRGDGGIGRSVVNSALEALEDLTEERDSALEKLEIVAALGWASHTRIEQLKKALLDLHEEVEMAESVGICLPDRVASLNASQVLAAHTPSGSDDVEKIQRFIKEIVSQTEADIVIGERSCTPGDNLNYGNMERLIREAPSVLAALQSLEGQLRAEAATYQGVIELRARAETAEAKVEELETVLATLHKEATAGGSY